MISRDLINVALNPSNKWFFDIMTELNKKQLDFNPVPNDWKFTYI